MDFGDLVDKGQKGIDMVKNVHSMIEGVDHPLLNDAIKTINDNTRTNEMINKLKDVDLNEVKKNIDATKKHAEGFFKMFQ